FREVVHAVLKFGIRVDLDQLARDFRGQAASERIQQPVKDDAFLCLVHRRCELTGAGSPSLNLLHQLPVSYSSLYPRRSAAIATPMPTATFTQSHGRARQPASRLNGAASRAPSQRRCAARPAARAAT